MNKIILITTEGCEGCAIMRKSILHALAVSKIDIDFEEKDRANFDKKFLATFNIKDFPTTLFFKNKFLTRKETGTRPYIVVLRWIDIDFK